MTKNKVLEIKEAYQSGQGSCRELAEKFGVSFQALRARCQREGWKVEMSQIASQVSQKVIEKVSDRAAQWVEKKLLRVQRCENDIDASRAQFATDDSGSAVMDMLNIKHMLNAEAQADEIARRCLGLKDNADKMEAPGGLELQAQLLAIIYAIKERVATTGKTIDISPEEVQRVAKLKVVKDS